ncbi:hypothetical protein D9611_004989 [Ephemerocybe angulata]|uniref:F-box domain-containing protein n=1 Tax=Ephemerocybe angulata TaxID=980116 RepID=A0A8H5B310_9AGAR|nr:hypothetical protein D9611_004989 [Tulosesus angulatus]
MLQDQPETEESSVPEEPPGGLRQSVGRRKAKGRYNTTPFSNRLPAEILSSIFLILASTIASQFLLTPWLRRGRTSWIYVTHVCRYWREVALDCATLWSNLLFFDPSLTEAMLSRSKDAPLSFALTHYHSASRFKDVLPKILSKTDRLLSVEIDNGINAAILDNFSRSAPILEKLALSCYLSHPTVNLTSTFLQGGAPSLKHLVLRRFKIESWNILPLGPRLTHLEIVAPTVQRPSAPKFIASFQAMPYLQTLILQDLLPEDEYPIDPVSNTICPPPFPALRRLKIIDTFDEVTDFFGAVDLPETATLSLTFPDSLSFDEELLEDFLTNLEESWQGLGSGVQKLVIHEDYEAPRMEFDFYAQDSGETSKTGPKLVIIVQEWSIAIGMDDIIVAFTAGMDLSPLQTLHLSNLQTTVITSDMWIRAFSLFEHLEVVEFRDICLWDFFEALGLDPAVQDGPQEEGGPQYAPHFPALTTIKFEGVNFNAQALFSRGFMLLAMDVGIRRESYPAIAIVVSRCTNFTLADLSELESMGIDVKWDRHVEMSEGDGTGFPGDDDEDWEDVDDENDYDEQ